MDSIEFKETDVPKPSLEEPEFLFGSTLTSRLEAIPYPMVHKRKNPPRPVLPRLGHDHLVEIFSQLDLRSLVQCKKVCRKWNQVIGTANKSLFARADFQEALIEPVGFAGEISVELKQTKKQPSPPEIVFDHIQQRFVTKGVSSQVISWTIHFEIQLEEVKWERNFRHFEIQNVNFSAAMKDEEKEMILERLEKYGVIQNDQRPPRSSNTGMSLSD